MQVSYIRKANPKHDFSFLTILIPYFFLLSLVTTAFPSFIMQLITLITTLSLPLVWAAPFSNESCSTDDEFTVGQTVKTSSGPVTGHASSKFPEVSVYLGIPFGQAPVGDLRFAAPVKFVGTSPINGSAFVCFGNHPEFLDAANVF